MSLRSVTTKSTVTVAAPASMACATWPVYSSLAPASPWKPITTLSLPPRLFVTFIVTWISAPWPGASVTPPFHTCTYTLNGPVGTWALPAFGQTFPAQPMVASDWPAASIATAMVASMNNFFMVASWGLLSRRVRMVALPGD
ncbi:MAG: hypothetical protein IPH86_01465 [bacterium]|nr:hypothetical protein [bacterium]